MTPATPLHSSAHPVKEYLESQPWTDAPEALRARTNRDHVGAPLVSRYLADIRADEQAAYLAQLTRDRDTAIGKVANRELAIIGLAVLLFVACVACWQFATGAMAGVCR